LSLSKLINYSTSFILLLLIASYFLAPNLRISYFPSYLIGLIGLSFALSGRFNQVILQTPIISILLAITVIAACISSFGASDAASALLVGGYGLLILTFVYCIAYLTEELSWFANALLGAVVTAACVSSAFSIYFFYSLDYQPLDEHRLFALGGLSNPVRSAISYGAALTLAVSQLAACRERVLGLLLAVMAIILLVAIGLTGTRSVWIGLFVAICALLYIAPTSARRRVITIATFAGVCMLLSIAGYIYGYADAITSRALSFRPEIWTATIGEWLSGNWLLGAGMQATIDLRIPPNEFAHPHSLYLSTLYYGGLIGLALLILLIGKLLWVLVRVADPILRVQTLPLLLFGLTTLLFDGNRLIEKVDFLWLCFWLPIALTLHAEAKYTSTQAIGSR
jgi:O-antigen ligase